ncbi:MAG TPA: acetylglutamate kinase [Thermoanaerobaculia bacterium]|nr:acetylglutamate kinase [Thermoanaerobaculia bacterium]
MSAAVPLVIKLGGSLLEDEAARAGVVSAIAGRWLAGERPVLVHGGGKRIDAALAARGIARRVHEGLRVTDRETLEVVVAVLADVNAGLVRELRAGGAEAFGLSEAEGGLIEADDHPPVGGVEVGFVGRVTGVASDRLVGLLERDSLPVLAPLARGPNGGPLNVNADAAAAAIAAALGARRLLFLTDVEGVADEAGRFLELLDPASAQRLLESPAVSGGMRPKLAACLAASGAGVREVVIAGPARRDDALAGGRGGTCLVAA